ncbi:MAG: transaldolase [Planctomycetota bacterium]|jgi:transaldolase|nr:transaldolase [Planctomycetota bacterium]
MKYNSPLHQTVMTTPTQFWNDSCSIEELKYAIEHGAVGATTNPVIVVDVLKKELPLWKDRIEQLIKTMDTATEDEIAWKLIEEMAVKGAELLLPIFNKEKGKKGRLSIQTNAKYYRNAQAMADQATYFATLAPNMQVKMPVTAAGVAAVEEATYRGVSINATVSFTVPQVLAVAEAVERGLTRRKKEGKDVSQMSPVCTMMVGRLDDYLKVVIDKEKIAIDPGYLEWAGVAAFKHAYQIYQQKKYTCKLLSAAYRNVMQWTEFVGGDVVLTITSKWQKVFNASGIDPQPRMDVPVEKKILDALLKINEFRRGYEADGLSAAEFADYGATRRTLTQFLGGYASLLEIIRGFMVKPV